MKEGQQNRTEQKRNSVKKERTNKEPVAHVVEVASRSLGFTYWWRHRQSFKLRIHHLVDVNRLAMASNLIAMASHLIAMASSPFL